MRDPWPYREHRELAHRWLGALCMGALSVGISCKDAPNPWDQPTGGTPPASIPTAAPVTAAPSASVVTGSRLESGGPFVTCYEHFVVSGEPLRDVTRLGLICGPITGMHRTLDVAYEGAIGEAGADLGFPLKLEKGSCYRIFAVADANVADLDVSVVSASDTVIAGDPGEGNVVVLQPDRPLCPVAEVEATVKVAARKGQGRFALEIYAMP